MEITLNSLIKNKNIQSLDRPYEITDTNKTSLNPGFISSFIIIPFLIALCVVSFQQEK